MRHKFKIPEGVEIREYRFSPMGSAVHSAVRRNSQGETSRLLVGHAAVFNSESVDFGGWKETIRKGAFKRAIKEKQDVRALLNHDSNFVLGRTKSGTLRLWEDDVGLAAEIVVADTQVGRDLIKSINRGDIDQMSFAFRVKDENWKEKKTASGDYEYLRELRDVDLFDVSPVTFPAYQQTDVTLSKDSRVQLRRLRLERMAREFYREERDREFDDLVLEQEIAELKRRVRNST